MLITFQKERQLSYHYSLEQFNRMLSSPLYQNEYFQIENSIWGDYLLFVELDFGNRNFNAIWRSEQDGRIFRMTSTQFEKICQNTTITAHRIEMLDKLSIKGHFTFSKKGQRIHIKLV